jgi:hypothetical protein
MTEQQEINPKVVERIRKLLALAQDGGATEGEAAAAMDRAQDIMAKYNITIATVELSGGSEEGGARLKTEYGGPEARKTKGGTSAVGAEYQRMLMSVICHVNLCSVYILQARIKNARGIWRNQPIGYEVIGRQVNVVAARTTFEYLNATINRLAADFAREHGTNNMSNLAISFKKGLSDRLQTRLWSRYFELKQKSKAEKDAAARAAAASGTPNALVLALEDVEAKERDANRDFELDLAPGTSERQRLEREARDRARALAEKDREPDPEPEETKEEERYRKKEERESARTNWAAYAAGEAAADQVSLDQQIDDARSARAPSTARRIGNVD